MYVATDGIIFSKLLFYSSMITAVQQSTRKPLNAAQLL